MIYKIEDEMLLKQSLLRYQENMLDNLPSEESLNEITFSEKFEKQMQKLIKSQKKPYYNMTNTVGKRFACVLVAIIILFTMMMSVSAIREPFIKYIVNMYEKYSQVFFSEETSITPETFEVYMPEYIPDGYSLVNQEKSTQGLYNYIDFEDANGTSLNFEQTTATGHININTEGVEVKKIYINNYEAIYWENNMNLCCVLYTDGTYNFTVICHKESVNQEEIIKIAESIQPEDKEN